MTEKNVIDFQKVKDQRIRRREQAKAAEQVLDTHDAVLDLSDVVVTTDHMVSTCDVYISDDTIIFSPKETEET